MASILVPGYLRWDGTKYVLDEDIEIVGPAGSTGADGPPGPVGPPGPTGTASGDISGNYPGPMAVVGLTGISGILPFGINVPNPTITQTATGATSGQTMTLKAQPAVLFGGDLALQSGTGTTAGIIKFLIGNTLAGEFDSAFRLRIGPNAISTFNIFASGPNTPYPGATHFLYSNNAAGRDVTGTFSGAANDYAATETINYSAGGNATTGIRLIAAGASSSNGSTDWQSTGAIDQIGGTTSALVFTTTVGSSGTTTTKGRIFQSGGWAIGNGFNATSSGAQAGITGPILSIASVDGTLTSASSDQAIIYNTRTPYVSPNPPLGALTLQGNNAITMYVGTTLIAGCNTSKFINSQGRRVKLATTTTSPYTTTVNDHNVSIGTITTGSVSTTVAAGSNGAILPQATINVGSTTGFPTSGAILVLSTQGAQLITYTSTTGTSFGGCSGGTGTLSTGNLVSCLFTVNMPASPASGDTYTIKDANGSAATNNIAIIGNGNAIDGQSPGIVISTNYTRATLTYNGTSWVTSLTNNISPGAGYTSVVNVVSGGTQNVIGQDQLLLCDPTSAPCTVQAPANPIANMRFTVKDATAKANVNAIVVQGNGRSLENPQSPGTYTSPINITTVSLSATWAFDPTRNRYTLV